MKDTSLVILLLVCTGASLAGSSRQKRCSELDNITKSGLVPDLLDYQPRQSVIVKYARNSVRQGNELSVDEVLQAPRVYLPNAKRDKLYTILMVDPDAPARGLPLLGPVLHYMVVNAPKANNMAGEEIVSYTAPSPPPGTGYHRYVFLVYEQKDGKINQSPLLPLFSRYRFSLDSLEEKSALIGPVAANFFLCQFSFI